MASLRMEKLEMQTEHFQSVQHHQLIVFGLPKCTLTNADLFNYFSRFAQVDEVTLFSKKGYGIVTLFYEESVNFILGLKLTLNGSVLRTDHFKAIGSRHPKIRKMDNWSKVSNSIPLHPPASSPFDRFRASTVSTKKPKRNTETTSLIVRTDLKKKKKCPKKKSRKECKLDSINRRPSQDKKRALEMKRKPIPLYVHSRRKYLVSVMTLDDLYKSVQEEEGIPSLLQMILYQGRLIKSDQDLKAMAPYDFVQIVVKGNGGINEIKTPGSLEVPVFTSRRKKHETSVEEKYLINRELLVYSEEIGEGACARVFRGKYLNYIPENVALKKYKLNKGIHKYKEMLRKEAVCLLNLNHENIVKCFGICLEQMTIVLEYTQKKFMLDNTLTICNNLRQVLDCLEEDLPEDIALEAIRQTASAMKYLHNKNIIHADLKSNNILVSTSNDEGWIFKITDFGESHMALNTSYHVQTSQISANRRVGTLPYIAPEVLQGQCATKFSDIYSFGMVMYEITNPVASYPWALESKGNEDFIKINVISGIRPSISHFLYKKWVPLMERCWHQEQQFRPSFSYIKDIIEDLIQSNNIETHRTENSVNSNLNKHASELSNRRSPLKKGVCRKLLRSESSPYPLHDSESVNKSEYQLKSNLILDKILTDDLTQNDELEIVSNNDLMQNDELESVSNNFLTRYVILNSNEDKFLCQPVSEADNFSLCDYNTPQKKTADMSWSTPPLPSLCFHKTPFKNNIVTPNASPVAQTSCLLSPFSPHIPETLHLSRNSAEITLCPQQTHSTRQQKTNYIPQSPISMSQSPVSIPQPSVSIPQPSVSIPQPPVSIPQPPVSIPQPSVSIPQSSVSIPQPSVSIPQSPVSIPQPPVSIPQPPVSIPQPSVSIPQPSVSIPQISFCTSDLSSTIQKTHSIKPKSSSSIPQLPSTLPQLTLQALPPNEQDVMKWSGYALKYFNITKLHQFQIDAINAYHQNRDVLVIRSTSGGKSLCYQLPAAMLSGNEVVLIVSPTIALAQDQFNYLHGKGIKVCLLGSMSKKTSYASIFSDDSETPQILIVTPETLMGGCQYKGIKDKLLDAYFSYKINLKLIAIDEAHLIWDWGGSFREAYNQLCHLKDIFKDVPIMALTATLRPESEEKMVTDILRQPVLLKGSIDRVNVSIHMMSYDPPQNRKGSWEKVALQIKDLIGEEKTIIYTSFANTCDAVCSSLLQLGLTASAYTGGTRTSEEKKEILNNMCQGGIQVLVATQAFGLGINIPWIRMVIHLGCPPNIPLWVQELGRAGRDGKPSKSFILFKEFSDTQRLKFWIDAGDREKKINDFVNMWQYIYLAMTGECLRAHQMAYFGEKGTTIGKYCCSGCEVKDKIPFVNLEIEKQLILDALKEIQELGLKCVTEKKVVAYLLGKEKGKDYEWLEKLNVTKEKLKSLKSFGSLSSKKIDFVKGLIRQLIAKNLIDLVFLENHIQGGKFTIMQRFLSAKEDIPSQNALFPNPELVWQNFFLNRTVNLVEKSSCSKKLRKKCSMINIIKEKLESLQWEPLELKEQYVYLGYPYCKNLLYTSDISTVPGCPVKDNKDHFIWSDISLTKGNGYPTSNITVNIKSKDLKVKIHRNDCKGVQTCSVDDCNYAISNRHRENRCLRHEDGTLVKTGPCTGTFIYIHPVDITDKQRWIGFFNKDFHLVEGHNHPCPVLFKPSSQLQEMIANCVRKDPTKTAADMAKGYGLPCLPAAVSAAGASKKTLNSIRSKYVTNLGNASAIQTLQNFNSLIKNQIDEDDINHMSDENIKDKVCSYSNSYLQDWNQTNEHDLMAWFMTPQMAEVFSLAEFVEADVTYPGCKVLKYLLNVACYNPLLLKWQVVGRVMMSNLTTKAYTQAFDTLLKTVTKYYPEFESGKNIKVWTVDFADAQTKALEKFTENNSVHIRGCRVHFLRTVYKIAERVSENDAEKNFF